MEVIDSFTGEYRFLSNFFPVRFEWNGRLWQTAEHAYQSCKTFDPLWKEAIARAQTPGKAKRLSRKVPLRPDWEDAKMEIMRGVVMAKFSLPKMRDCILATGHAQLIEGNDHGDRFWGTVEGVGENHLGKILMSTRKWLYNERIQRGV